MAEVTQQQLIDFEEFNINDKVKLFYGNELRIGIVKGFYAPVSSHNLAVAVELIGDPRHQPDPMIVDVHSFALTKFGA